ncbi:MAG: hypothetical protein ABIJ08_04320, partial [Nanoarchaeota archaeon]
QYWDDYINATQIFNSSYINFSTASDKPNTTFDLEIGTSGYNLKYTCSRTGNYLISIYLVNTTNSCELNYSASISEWYSNPNLENSYFSELSNMTIGKEYPYFFLLNNSGEDNATDINFTITLNNNNLANFTSILENGSVISSLSNNSINIFVNEIENKSSFNYTFNITTLEGGNLNLSTTLIYYDRSNGDAMVPISRKYSQNNHINYNPTLTQMPNITFLVNTYNISLNFSDYYSDQDTYDDILNANWNYTGNTNITVFMDFTTYLINFSADTDWRGHENITFHVNDTYNMSSDNITITISVINSSIEICNGRDDNGDYFTDIGCDDDNDGYCDTNMAIEVGSNLTTTCNNTDSTSNVTIQASDDCNDASSNISPGVSENCNDNAIDDDCDGYVDSNDPDCATPTQISNSCFLAGTKITYLDGSTKNIEDVKVGDSILSYNTDNNQYTNAVVLELESPIRNDYYIIKLEDNEILKITDEHPVYTQDGWASIVPEATLHDANLNVKKLNEKDKILNVNKRWIKIKEITHIREKVQTYNLKHVSNTNTFFANDILVHNKGTVTSTTASTQSPTVSTPIKAIEKVEPKPPQTPTGSASKEPEKPKPKSVYENLINEIAKRRVEHTRHITVKGGRTQIIEKVKNIDLFEIEDAEITLEIPKTIIENTDKIIEITPYEIIDYDPKVKFLLDNIDPEQEKVIEYTIDKELTDEEIKQILLKIDMKNITNQEERERLFNQTQEVIDITTTAKVDTKNNQTEFTIDIDFKNETILYDANIYMEIPKCLVEIIEKIMIESEVEFDIVAEDPIIVWHFKKLTKGDSLNYIIKSIADEDCLNQAKTYAIAKQIVLLEADLSAHDKLKRIYGPIGLILLLILTLSFLSRFSMDKKHYFDRLENIIRQANKQNIIGLGAKGIRLIGFEKEDIKKAREYEHKPKIIRFFNKNLFGGEMFFLIILVLLNIADFIKILPGDIDFLKKIISWILLSYLLYEASLMKSLFGAEKHRKVLDVTLLLLYFSLIFKLVVEFAKTSFNEAVYFRDLLLLIAKYSIESTNISLYIGFIGLAAISFFITCCIPIGSPSFYEVFTSLLGKHKVEKANIVIKKTLKFISVYLVLLLFYITFYNFIFEWLAIAIDASILTVVLIMTLVIFIKKEYHMIVYHKIKEIFRFRVMEGIEKIMEKVDSFDIKFFKLLPYKKFIYLAIIGILILHLLTEAGIFIIPYVIGATDATYFSELGPGHTPILNLAEPLHKMLGKEVPRSLLQLQIGGLNILNSIPIVLVYLMNIFAVLFLLINPLIIWLHMHKERKLPAHLVSQIKSKSYKVFQFLFMLSIGALILTPIFSIDLASSKVFGETEMTREFEASIRGIDIRTQLIQNENMIFWALGIGIFLAIMYLLLNKKLSRQLTGLINTANLTAILGYLIFFYSDVQKFYMTTLSEIFHTNMFFFVHFGIFFIISGLFYIIGIILLVFELFARGEIYIPSFVIKMIRFVYKDIENVYHYISPHHHLPYLRFYEHHIESEHGSGEKHIYDYITELVQTIYNKPYMLNRLTRETISEGKGELAFIEEHLIEHNWPKEMVKESIE